MKSHVIRIEYHECGEQARILFIREHDGKILYHRYNRKRTNASRYARNVTTRATGSALFAGIIYSFEKDTEEL